MNVLVILNANRDLLKEAIKTLVKVKTIKQQNQLNPNKITKMIFKDFVKYFSYIIRAFYEKF